jgi:hypothetical protein
LGEHNLVRRDNVTLLAATRQLAIFTATREGKRKGTAADTATEDAMINALTDYLNGGTHT